MANVGVHLFDVSSESGRDLTDLIRAIKHTPKVDRWRDIGMHGVALLETRYMAEHGVHLLDFVKRREVGPGKVRRDSDIQGFEFEVGENFGEETAAVWCPRRNWLVVQYNQHGVRAGSINRYFNDYYPDASNDWVIMPRLSDQAAAELSNRPLVRAATMKFSVRPMLTEAMRESGQAVGDALSMLSNDSAAADVEVRFTMGHQAGFINRTISSMMQRLSQDFDAEDGLKSMRVKARAIPEGQDKVIDLLQDRIKTKFPTRALQIEAGRYTLVSRWDALLRIHLGWDQEL